MISRRRAVAARGAGVRSAARRVAGSAWSRWSVVVVVALLAAGAAMATLGARQVSIGPVEARVALVPSLSGGTVVQVPPLGELVLRTQAGPLQLRARVDGLRTGAAQALFAAGATGDGVADAIEADVRSALVGLVVRSGVVALLAAALAVALVFRRVRAVVVAVASVGVALAASGLVAWGTLDVRALSEPRFTGLLTRAPALTGGLADVEGRFKAYRARVATLTGSVSRLYSTLSGLPEAGPSTSDTAVLWVSDIHDNPEALTLARTLVAEFDCRAVVDTGDDTDFGSETENAVLAPIATLGVPWLVVRGNHDSLGSTQPYLASLPNVTVLDEGSTAQVAGIRFAGTGDPRYAPSGIVESASSGADLRRAGRQLASAIDAAGDVDVALVHEPAMASPLMGHVPLVLDGHLHRRAHAVARGTLELTQGSSGGAGLRTLETRVPLPLQMSVLHFDPTTHRLLSVDDLTVAGVGESSATLDRHTAASYAEGSSTEPESAGVPGDDADQGASPSSSPELSSPTQGPSLATSAAPSP